MFQSLKPLPTDPILGLMGAFGADEDPRKIDLGVGVYRDAAGATPVMKAVKQAEESLLREQLSKAYVGPSGAAAFNEHMAGLLLGEELNARLGSRRLSMQVPGGCGGLRLAAEFINAAAPGATVWVSDPSWANHVPLLGAAGLQIQVYPYYDRASHSVRFDDMMAALSKAAAKKAKRGAGGDVLLLHGCCHNPCGADLNIEQWRAVKDLALEKGFTVLVDLAYQGFGDGLDEDAAGVRLLAAELPELIVVASCSKNFGLYRERTGALTFIGSDAGAVQVAATRLSAAARALYSMPPDHGAAVVQRILDDAKLRWLWESELGETRQRINETRSALVRELTAAGLDGFGFIEQEKGMFSYLGVTPKQVRRLVGEFSIYLVDSGRINVAGLNGDNMGHFTAAMAAVVKG